MKRSSTSGRSIAPASTRRSRSKLSTLPLVVVVVAIQGVDLFLEVLLDLLALDLQRGGELALFLRQLARQDRELLDLLDVREVLVGLVDRLLDRVAAVVLVVVVGVLVAVDGHEGDEGGPVVADHDRLRDLLALGDLLLDVRRGDVLAGRGDDDVLRAAGDLQEALFVDLAEVAGVEPAVLVEHLLGLLIESVVTLEDVRAAHEDLAAGALILRAALAD